MAISDLKRDWDGYDADPIMPSVIHQMSRELDDPRLDAFGSGHIVPGADGSLQAEWDFDDESFGLLVEADGSFTFWVQPPNGQETARKGIAGRDLMQGLALGFRAS